jgi:hypothetical protein
MIQVIELTVGQQDDQPVAVGTLIQVLGGMVQGRPRRYGCSSQV